MKEFEVGPGAAGGRLDVFLAAKYPQFSRASLGTLFDSGKVRLNAKEVKPGFKIRAGDIASVDDSLLFTQPDIIELPTIYEDKDVVVIDKPAGVLTHSKGALNIESTVASFLATKITDKDLTGNRAGIVHRLDRATSGVIISAKTKKATAFLQRQFASRQTEKTYRAIIEGLPEPREAIIDAPIARNPKRPQTFRVAAGGKPAQTAYRVLKEFAKGGRHYAYLEIKPITGRTHQIRVHLNYIGHPVVGDAVYGLADNLLLHAYRLKIKLPSGEHKTFTAPLPQDIRKFMEV